MSKTVKAAQAALKGLSSVVDIVVDGDNGPQTKAAKKAVTKTAAKVNKTKDIALGIGGITVAGIIAFVEGGVALWGDHGAAVTSGDWTAIAGAGAAFAVGVWKLLQQLAPEWF